MQVSSGRAFMHTALHVMLILMFYPTESGVPLFHPRVVEGTMFASQYVQQLRIQRSLKSPLRSYHLFVGELKTVN